MTNPNANPMTNPNANPMTNPNTNPMTNPKFKIPGIGFLTAFAPVVYAALMSHANLWKNAGVKWRIYRNAFLIMIACTSSAIVDAAPISSIPILYNKTTETVVFDDNFEECIVPSYPTALNFPATALTGSWAYGQDYGTHTTGVVNASRSASGDVVSQEGGHFLMQSSAYTGSGRPMIARGVVANSGATDTIAMNVAFNFVSDGEGAVLYLYGGASQTTLIQALYIRGTATGTISANSVGVLDSTGTAWVKVGAGTELAFTPGIWNSLSIEHTNRTDQWAISLNGGTAITVTGLAAGTTDAFNGVTFNQTSPSTVYFDSVVIEPDAVTTTAEVVANPGFENDLLNWNGSSSNVAIDSSVFHSGGSTKSVRLIADAAPATHTSLLNNESTGTVVFDDNFEGYTVPSPPTALNLPTTAGALTGTWAYGQSYGTHTTGVVNTSRSISGSVPPQEGTEFLMQSSAYANSGRQMIARGVVPNSGATDTISMNVAFNFVPGGQGALIYLYGGASQTTLLQALYIRGTATGTISANSVGVLDSTGTAWVKVGAGTELAFAPGTWNSISVIHTNGTDQWAISLNGGAAITVTGLSAGTTNAFNSVTFSQISPSTVYFDTSGEAWQTVEQTVPIYGDGGNHPISLWMKTQNSKNSRAKVTVGANTYEFTPLNNGDGTNDWSQINGDVLIPAGINSITIQAEIQGSYDKVNPGYLWVDDVSVEDSLRSELDRGHYLLLCRGLQIEGLVFPRVWQTHPTSEWVGFDVNQFLNANFTTVNFWQNPSEPMYLLGEAAYEVLWSRFVGEDMSFVISESERPNQNNMVRIQLGDEQTLAANAASPHEPESIATSLAVVRQDFPNQISCLNQSGAYVNEPNWSNYFHNRVKNYMATSQPDMIMFDSYFYQWAAFQGGSPTDLYEHWQKYRLLGLAGNDGTGNRPVPFGLYLQYYIPDTEPATNYAMSDSETRLSQFAAWTFGYKFVSAFTYNNAYGDEIDYLRTVLFTGSGDANPTALFDDVAETNRQSLNLGSALVKLLSNKVCIVKGQHYDTASSSVVDNTTPLGVPVWHSTDLSPFITSVHASNLSDVNLDASSNPLAGDVVLGSFTPLHESFDGPSYQNQDYFMILNGLSWADSLVSETRQAITIDFNFGSSDITGLQRLRRSDGVVESINTSGSYTDLTWTQINPKKYRMVLTLDGGTGDLFKYDTGAPFVGQ